MPHMPARPLLTPRRRFMVWVACVIGLLLGTPLWFLLLRGPRILDSDAILFTGWIVLSGLILAIWYLLKTTPPDAIKLKPKRSQWVIMLGALWLHANAIVWLIPSLSDDVLRYRHDGLMVLYGESPYASSPADRWWRISLPAWIFDLDSLDHAIPHSRANSIYLPTSQVVFAGIRWAERRTFAKAPLPASVVAERRRHGISIATNVLYQWDYRARLHELQFSQRLVAWRLAFGGMMLAATWLLMRCCLRLGRSPWWAVLVGWHPLAIIETSGMAHQDAIGILLLAAAFLAWLRASTPSPGTPGEGWGEGQGEPEALTPTLSHGYMGEGESALSGSSPAGGGQEGAFADAGTMRVAPLDAPPPSLPRRGRNQTLEYSTLAVKSNRFALPAAGVLLALACGVKPLAVLPAAFWFIARPSARWVVPFIVTALVLGSVLLYQDGYIGFFKTLRTYTQTWEANGSFFHVIRSYNRAIYQIDGLYIEPWELARMLGAILVCGVSIGLVLRRAHWTTAFYWIVLTILLVAPVVYPWYLLWLMVIIPLLNPRWGLTGLVFAATVTFNYRLWHEPQWVLPWSWLAAEYAPVYAALAIEIITSRTSYRQLSQ